MADRGGSSLRKLGMIMDWGHIIIGVAEIVLAVFAFIDPSGNKHLFPVIFLLAAILNIGTGAFIRYIYQRNSGKRVAGALYIIFGVLIFALFVISAISIWGPVFRRV